MEAWSVWYRAASMRYTYTLLQFEGPVVQRCGVHHTKLVLGFKGVLPLQPGQPTTCTHTQTQKGVSLVFKEYAHLQWLTSGSCTRPNWLPLCSQLLLPSSSVRTPATASRQAASDSARLECQGLHDISFVSFVTSVDTASPTKISCNFLSSFLFLAQCHVLGPRLPNQLPQPIAATRQRYQTVESHQQQCSLVPRPHRSCVGAWVRG